MIRILYLCYDTPGVMNDWQDYNFIHEMRSYQVFIEKHMIPITSTPNQVVEVLSHKLSKIKYDLFMTGCDDRSFSDSLFSLLNQFSLPSLLFCCDNLSVPFIHKMFCSRFTLVWLTSNETKYLFDKWNATSIYLPYAANPILYRPINGPEISGISFVGSIYGVRLSKLELLNSTHVPVNIYGKGLSTSQPLPTKYLKENMSEAIRKTLALARFKIGREALKGAAIKTIQGLKKIPSTEISIEIKNKLISFEEIPNIYSRSQLSLGITELWNTYLLKTPVHKLHLRTFEIPMSGGLQIVSRSEPIEDCYEENNEIILYDNNEELISKINFYTSQKNFRLREKIKVRARNRSLKCHTWSNRFRIVLDRIGINHEIK